METTEDCSTPEELAARRAWWFPQPGVKIFDFEDVPGGEFGFIAARSGEEPRKVLYRPFGDLQVLERVVQDPKAFVESYRIHSVHGDRFWRTSDPKRLLKGFTCYCEASSRISHVVYASLATLRRMVEPRPGTDPMESKDVLDWVRLSDDRGVLEKIVKARRG